MKAEGRSDFDNVQAGVIVDNGCAQCAADTRARASCAGDDHQSTILVRDNFPAVPAISDAELDAIERYMGDILDLVLGGAVMPLISERDDRLS